MGRDYPDWGGRFKSQTKMMLYDLAELAARLGSPVTYERNGRMMFATEFNTGLDEFITNSSGVDGSVTLTTTAYSGGFAALLQTGTTLSDWAYMQRYEPDMGETSVGLSFYIAPFSAYGKFTLDFARYSKIDGIDMSRIAWEFDTGDITIETPAAPFPVIYNYLPTITPTPLWTFIKFVLEPTAGRVLRMQINGQLINLAEYAMLHISTTTLDALIYKLQVTNTTAGQNTRTYIDRVVYTIDEPLND